MTARPLSPGRQVRARLVRAMAVAGLAVLAGFGSATTASAHSQLEGTNPADGAQVAALPEQITLTFNQDVLGVGTAVQISGPGGSVVDGAPTVVDKEVRQAILPGSAAGDYTVQWRVTSADGHPISGQFAFSAAAGSGGSRAATSAAVDLPAGDSTGGNAPLIWLLVAFVAVLAAGVALARRTNSASRAEAGGEGSAQTKDVDAS
ncbi:MAG TPA: copper resistance CopC family protein [Kineosporiaceae bacterium]|nr:copper resistance CopC family protein [Kineosporiaceae bacterium]